MFGEHVNVWIDVVGQAMGKLAALPAHGIRPSFAPELAYLVLEKCVSFPDLLQTLGSDISNEQFVHQSRKHKLTEPSEFTDIE